MCGELEDDGPAALEDHLYTAFLAHARALLAEQARNAGQDPGSAAAYADKLFDDALMRARTSGTVIRLPLEAIGLAPSIRK